MSQKVRFLMSQKLIILMSQKVRFLMQQKLNALMSQKLSFLMSQKVNVIMSQKLSFLLSQNQNILMLQKVNFLLSQSLSLNKHFVANSEFFSTQHVIVSYIVNNFFNKTPFFCAVIHETSSLSNLTVSLQESIFFTCQSF